MRPFCAENEEEVAMSNVVLVVDMLRWFLEPSHNFYHADSRRIVPTP